MTEITEHHEETPDQYESAIEQLYRLLVMACEHRGSIASKNEMMNWLLKAADEKHRQGDYGAERILERLAGRTLDE
ncbi:hypothetical protein Q0601_00565 [Paracoccus onubensis]|uniref:hypothetical protein n=1 Tax=Paracoccus onubensis TaxID=1675788 RepID=UPI0027304D59|nr:hypothetical protein [Paracoccus onubensis]MDP0925654.1 hypothetical protein [Paracoccus onubensis]